MALLEIKNLSIEVGGKIILEDLNLTIEENETLALLGPNGSGKTSLIMAIMGFSNYKVAKGDIIFKGQAINAMTIDQRAKLGMGIMLQKPPSVRGVKTRQIVQMTSRGRFKVEEEAKKLDVERFLNRDINLNFSGGEIKRTELYQLAAQSPDFTLFDEPESGVDLENMQLVGKGMNAILGRGRGKKTKKSGLIITHTGFILDYVKVDRGCVLLDKKLHCIGDPKKILKTVHKFGYQRCIECKEKQPFES